MSEISIKAILGESPNEIWSRCGQTLIVFGALSLIGFKGFGVELLNDKGNAPLILIALGVIFVYIGTRLRRLLTLSKQAHEIEQRRATRTTQKATEGDRALLRALRDEYDRLKRPLTESEIIDLPVPYQDDRSKEELLHSIKLKSAEFWAREGTVRQEDGRFSIRQSDATVIQQ